MAAEDEEINAGFEFLIKNYKVLFNEAEPDYKPYQFKYTARKILRRALKELENLLKSEPVDLAPKFEDDDYKVSPEEMEQIELCKEILKQNDGAEFRRRTNDLIHILRYYLGENYLDTEERGRSDPLFEQVETYFTQSNEYVYKHGIILTRATNYLGIIWSARGDNEKTSGYLMRAENLYNKLMQRRDLYNEDDINTLESIYTHTLYFLAQFYQIAEENDKASHLCHTTLRRQLELHEGTYQPREWAENCMTLSSFYKGEKQFRQAEHCLQAAQTICPKINTKDDDILEFQAQMNWTWGDLHSAILGESVAVLLRCEEDEDLEIAEEIKTDGRLSTFDSLGLEAPGEITLALNWREAVLLFREAIKYYGEAVDYYILDGFVTKHCEIVTQICHLYNYMMHFEDNYILKCRMMKRRIDLMKGITTQINPAAFLVTVRQFHHDIAIGYDQMGDFKTKQFEVGRNDQKFIRKINEMYRLCLHHFKCFVLSYEYPPQNNNNMHVTGDGNLPFDLSQIPGLDNNKSSGDREKEEIDEHLRAEYLSGKMHSATVHTKLILRNKEEQLNSIDKALDLYTEIVHYYKTKGPLDDFKDEFEMCKQMKELLPYKKQQVELSTQI